MPLHIGIYGDPTAHYGDSETIYGGDFTLEADPAYIVVTADDASLVAQVFDPDVSVSLKAVIGGN